MTKLWKKGRGKLGLLDPLLGQWIASASTPMGPVHCTRSFETVLGGSYVQLDAKWEFARAPGKEAEAVGAGGGGGYVYHELAIFGAGEAKGSLSFWSFTSDGKRSQGVLADGTDIHEEAIAFEAQMPAGLARMTYWPRAEGGFNWAVESKTKKGWRRFVEHTYGPL